MIDVESLDRDVADRRDSLRLFASADLRYVARGADRRELLAVVREPELRVLCQRLPVALNHLRRAARAVHRQRRAHAAHPAHDQEVRQIGGVVGVQVGDQDGVDALWWQVRLVEAQRSAPADVHEDVRASTGDYLARAEPVRLVYGAAGPQKRQFKFSHLSISLLAPNTCVGASTGSFGFRSGGMFSYRSAIRSFLIARYYRCPGASRAPRRA